MAVQAGKVWRGDLCYGAAGNGRAGSDVAGDASHDVSGNATGLNRQGRSGEV